MRNRQRYEQSATDGLAVGLGWFSIGLGVAELVAPRQLAHFIGLRATPNTVSVMQSFGAREIATGIAILSQPDNATWLWGRVAGDAMDLASLASAASNDSYDRTRSGLAALAVAGVTAADIFCAQQLRQSNGRDAMGVNPRDRRAARRVESIDQAITINASIERVRTFCQTPDQLPKSIRALVADTPIDSVLSIRPAPGNRGTELRVHIPDDQARTVFNRLASIVGQDVAGYVRDDLRKVKQLIEIGEVVVSEGKSMYRPAQPAADPAKLRTAAGV